MANERKEFEKFIFDCFEKVTKMVLQARNMGQNIPRETDNGFNLETDQMDVRDKLVPWKTNWYAPLGIDVLFHLPKLEQPVLLERWKVVLEPPYNVVQSSNYRKVAFVIIIRAIYACLRILPAYKLVRALKKNKTATASFQHTILQPTTSTVLFPPGSAEEFKFGTIETPFGHLSISVNYNTKPGISPSDLEVPLNSQIFIHDYDEGKRPPSTGTTPTDITGKSAPIAIAPARNSVSPVGIGVSAPTTAGYSGTFGGTSGNFYSTRFGTPLLSTSPTNPFGKESTPPSVLSVTPPVSSLLMPATLGSSVPSNASTSISSSLTKKSLSPPSPENYSIQNLSITGLSPSQDASESVEVIEENAFATSSATENSIFASFSKHVETAAPLKLFDTKGTRTTQSLFDELAQLAMEYKSSRTKQ